MPKFRKRPVIIEAVQFTGGPDSAVAVMAFAGLPETAYTVTEIFDEKIENIVIHTLEGAVTASVDDWIICGVKGEFYPCKPDIFAQTYEAV